MRVLIWTFCLFALCCGVALPFVAAAAGHFLSLPRIALFGVAPAAIAMLSALAMWRGDQARKLFLAYGVAVGCALLLAETYQWWKLRALHRAAAAEAANDRGAPLRALGVRAYPPVCGVNLDLRSPALHIDGAPVQPVSGLSHNLLTPELADHSAWRLTDRYGFNNPPGAWDEAPVNVATVGDSFTFGADVPIGKGFVDRIRARLGKTINLGCSGNGPLLDLASLAEYGALARPRIVLWVFYEGNDLNGDLASEQQSPILPRYLSAGFSQGLVGHQREIEKETIAFLTAMLAKAPGASTESWRTVLHDIASLQDLRIALGITHRYPGGAVVTLEQTLVRAQEIASTWGGRLVFVYLPDQQRYVTLFGRQDAEAYAEPVRAMLRARHIPLIDIADTFAHRPDPGALFHGHYTEEGYRLVGDTIADALEKLH